MEKAKLGDVCKVQGGYAFKSKEFQKDNVPIIRIGNIQDNEVEIDYNVCFTKEFLNKHPEFEIKYGDILIAMSGATVGKIGKYQNDTKALLNQRVGNFIVTEKLEKRYLYFLLQSPLFEKFILNNAFGCAQPNISSKQIEEFEFCNYDNAEQLEIANQLDKVQGIIDIRKKQIEQLDELIESHFVAMFGDIKDTKYKVMKLEELTNLITDGEHKKPNYTEDGQPFISVVNITTGDLKFDNCKFVSTEDSLKFQKRCKPERNDILYTKVGATYGRSAIVNTDRKFSLYVSVCLIKPKSELINPIFLNHTMRQPYVKIQADKCIKGIGVPDLHLIEIKKFNIIVPPLELQNKFAEFVKQVDKQKFEIQKSLEEIQKLQESLMNKYFNGG